MINFKKKLEKNFNLFKKTQNKIDKKKKTFSLFNFFESFYSFFYKKNTLSLAFEFLALLGLSIFIISFFYLILFKADFQLLTIPFILMFFLFSIMINLNLINRFFALFFIPKLLKNNFSKKEILLIKKFKTKNINNINNIFNFFLKNIKLKKEDFKDIVDFFNNNKKEINNNEAFNIINDKLKKQFKNSEISENELKAYIKYFITEFNIKDNEIIKKAYLDIHDLTFKNNKMDGFNNINKTENIIF